MDQKRIVTLICILRRCRWRYGGSEGREGGREGGKEEVCEFGRSGGIYMRVIRTAWATVVRRERCRVQ